MASFLYTRSWYDSLADPTKHWSTEKNNIVGALITEGYPFDTQRLLQEHKTWSDASAYELVATNYAAKPVSVTFVSPPNFEQLKVVFAKVEWPNLTAASVKIVGAIYYSTASQNMYAFVDFRTENAAPLAGNKVAIDETEFTISF